mmetsp:Transcript_51130/g.135071  ORF Transcript_51130/g.135071 Transcript_51130/m.135071 type:complete len:358 (+) Transcript_51130:130-1203(+)
MGCASARAVDVAGDNELTQNYELGNMIGKGTYGKIFEATHRETKKVRAVKVLEFTTVTADQALLAAWEEERMCRRVGRHENIVKLLDVFSGDRHFCMVMERCEQSLTERMPSLIHMCGSGLSKPLRQMLGGLAQVHGRRVVHRDIKPDNFLLGGPDGRTVKLCDFGMSAVEPRNGRLLRGTYGTMPYMSPEMLGAEGHDRSTDLWSLGAVTYMMVYGDLPYTVQKRSHRLMKAAIMHGPQPTFTSLVAEAKDRKIPDGAESLARAALRPEPGQRRLAEDLLRHPYLADGAPSGQRKCAKALSAGSSRTSSGEIIDMDLAMTMASTETGGTRSMSMRMSSLASLTSVTGISEAARSWL